MKKFVIYGFGDFADIMEYYLTKDCKREVVAFTADREYCTETSHNSLPVVPFDELISKYSPDQFAVVIGVVGAHMFCDREKIYWAVKKAGYELPNIIHSTASVSAKVMGDANFIMDNVTIGPFVTMGNNNMIWPNVSIAHHNKIGSNNQFAGCSSTIGMTEIGDNCFIGNNSTIYRKIASFTFVGAGAYVSSDTKPYEVIVPARSITLENHRSTDFM